jgi:hypothetical protein
MSFILIMSFLIAVQGAFQLLWRIFHFIKG